ncbi:MAG: hypothetical protein ACLFQK_01520 [Fibrobacterota bacterium]
MKSIVVKCPECGDISELFLTSDAHMIILNCPGCKTPMMYYYGNTFKIDEKEIEKFGKDGSFKNIAGLLGAASGKKQFSSSKAAKSKPLFNPEKTKSKTKEAPVNYRKYEFKKEFRPRHKAGEPVSEKIITRDDVINLKIEFSRINTVQEFLDYLE